MKKVIIFLVSLVSILAFNTKVYAVSSSLEVNNSSVKVGDEFTVTAKVNSAAAWNVHVSASGPVDSCSINEVDVTADALDTDKTFSATCTATGTGTINLTLSGDAASASGGNVVTISGRKTVTVSQTPNPVNNNNNNNISSNVGNNTNNNSSNPYTSYEVNTYFYSLFFGIICLISGLILLKRRKIIENKK